VTSIVLSVNGIVAAVSDRKGRIERGLFAGLIPPSLLVDGANDVRVYAMDRSGQLSSVPVR
jgi:hypothetical protein